MEFRKECRVFADKWIDVQRQEFKRLGVTGDWDDPYLTMSYDAEAQIAREIMKFGPLRPALSRLQAGDVVGCRKRPRWPRRRWNIMRRHRTRSG